MDSPIEHGVERTRHAVQVEREHQRPGVLRLAARARADEAAQVLDRAASPLSRLCLQTAQRRKLALPRDHTLDALDAKGPDQLVLEVGDADVEAEALKRGAVQVAAEAGALEGPPKVWLLVLVAEATQDDLGALAAQRQDEPANRVRAAHGHDLDVGTRETQAAPPRERLQCDLVALPLHDDDRARPCGRFHWAGTVAASRRGQTGGWMVYVVFLRAINVGGKGIVSMGAIKQALVDLGLSDVRTYINSGNVIFSSRVSDSRHLAAKGVAVDDRRLANDLAEKCRRV